MKITKKRYDRLADVAKKYYIDSMIQSEIAKELGISRPLVSRMLSEAKEFGIVDIKINDFDNIKKNTPITTSDIIAKFSLKNLQVVKDGTNNKITNKNICHEAVALLKDINTCRLGIGWGHIIGELVNYIQTEATNLNNIEHVMPLVGNANIAMRNYHSNENTRIIAEHLNATPHFLSLPAIAECLDEKQLLCSTEIYKQAYNEWLTLDTVIVNIGNYPSTPDFASYARYGELLRESKACGRILAYFLNEQGEIIHSNNDFAIQIPLKTLSSRKNIIGICSANTSAQALKGALSSNICTHIITSKSLLDSTISIL